MGYRSAPALKNHCKPVCVALGYLRPTLQSSACFVAAGVLCEVVNPEDGSMARTPQLLEFAKQHRLRCITIADLVRYRLQYDVYASAPASS